MKKADVDEAEPIGYDRLNKSALPRISYSQAMAMYIIIPSSGQVRSVECASAEEFRGLVKSCVLPDRSARTAQSCSSALKGLCYDDLLSRWFALCELLLAGATVPLFSTSEQARQSLLEPVEA